MESIRFFGIASLTMALAAFALVGCPSSEENGTPPADDAGDSTKGDAGQGGDHDSGPSDANDAGPDGTGDVSSFVPRSSSGFNFVIPPESSDNPSATPFTFGSMLFSSKPDGVAITCTPFSGSMRAQASMLRIQIGSSGDKLKPRVYAMVGENDKVSDGKFAASFDLLGAECESTIAGMDDGVEPTSGTVTIATVTDSEVTGTYDLTFPSGSTKGSFTISNCTKPQADIVGAKDMTCVQ